MENNELSITQKSALYESFKRDEIINTQFDIKEGEMWLLIGRITEKQKRFINMLRVRRDYKKLIEVLTNIGFRRKNL